MPNTPTGSPTDHGVPNSAADTPEPALNPASHWDAKTADAIEKLDDNLVERLEVDPSRGDVKG